MRAGAVSRSARPKPSKPAAPEAPAPAAPVPLNREVQWLTIRGARHNNLKNLDVAFPLGRFVVVTGVSGSGKSSLVNDILHEALALRLNGAITAKPGEHDSIEGIEHLDKIIAIDQTPIGRTPRSNPATYIKVFDEIRDLYTKLPDAKLRGYRPGRFSFNVPAGPKGGGRCEACEGNGSTRVEMDFLADVWVTCPVCEGRRFSRETLQMLFKGKSIGDVLEMDIQTALDHFESQPRIRAMLQTLHDVGLDYIKLGQPSPTLSGGEAQRIKLARELVKKPTGRTMYVLDEPTTGLHFADVRKLLAVLHGFVDAGNSVVVIEHNTDVIKTADWLIDLGPEGGAGGGRIIATGTPEEIAENPASETGKSLRKSSELRIANSASAAGAAPRSRSKDHSLLATRNAELVSPAVLRVRGARQHNLKDISVEIPRDQMTVCSGVSGSGKTSFAIDTVFTEGYRRYVESLSAYARQFLGQLQKPDVDHIEGLSPAICIEQRAGGRSPRSTVGTVTEIYDYMRVLWARVGQRYCPKCEAPIGSQTVDQIVDRVLGLEPGSPITLLAPMTLGDGETYAALFNRLKASGYTRVRIDGKIEETAHATTLDARTRHRVDVVVDRAIVRKSGRARIAESVEHALALGNGLMTLLVDEVEVVPEHLEVAEGVAAGGEVVSDAGTAHQLTKDVIETLETISTNGSPAALGDSATPKSRIQSPKSIIRPARELLFSQKLACLKCGTSYEELSPHQYSFNIPLGWCETCEGLGVQRGAAAGAIIRHPHRALLDGAIAGWGKIDARTPLGRTLASLCHHLGVSVDAPLSTWTQEQKQALLFGTSGDWIAADEAEGKQKSGKGSKAKEQTAPFRFHWRGFFPAIDHATRHSWTLRHKLNNVLTDIPCITCRGGRLRADAAATRLSSEWRVASHEFSLAARAQDDSDDSPLPASGSAVSTITQVCNLPLRDALAYFEELKLPREQKKIAGDLLLEIRTRLKFLIDVGLDYLTLHRAAPTLSGGESQRIRLASQIGSGLSGVLYVLDEPTIGLHPRDTQRLIQALHRLRDLGNTLLVVEHDRDVIRSADRLLDFGPRAGRFGGQIVADTSPSELVGRSATDAGRARKSKSPTAEDLGSLTRDYLTGRSAIPIPVNRRPVDANSWEKTAIHARPQRSRRQSADTAGKGGGWRARLAARAPTNPDDPVSGWLVVRGARQNNLKNVTVTIPLGRFVCVTGVSGSGKSSLINDIIAPALARHFNLATSAVGEHDAIEGLEHLSAVINVDQSPIGTTPLSNPATYTGVFEWIRELFARLPDSKVRGYTSNRFSFNRPGGRCEACEGYGQKKIEMHFMPDVWVECEVCRGRRYNPESLEVRYKGRNISEVLDLSVADAVALFENVPRVRRMLQTLADVGLDYVQLGQAAPTLSGGEAQRVKLATELGKPDTGRTLYILDEPTTGLHFDDVRKLLAIMHRLVDLGNTVLVVEHNLDVIKNADWIIELGPEAGDAGGRIVAMGKPEELNREPRVAHNELGGASAKQRAAIVDHALVATRNSLFSHTAAALAPLLASDPRETRPRYDPAEHARQELEAARAGLGKVGREVKMPWQVDGRKWHLELRPTRGGGQVKWESDALSYIVDLVQDAGEPFGGFAPTNWNERASVEITAPNAERWFMHALTAGEWLLDLYFRVPNDTFDAEALNRQIGLKTLDEREDIQAYGSRPRVEIRPRIEGVEAVAISVHDKAEIKTPGFERFVKAAVRAYFGSLGSSD